MFKNNNIFRKIFKYLFMVLLTSLGITYISVNKLNRTELVSVIMYVIICFIFLDMYYPVFYCN